MAEVNFQIDEDIKTNAESVLNEMGLDLSTAITLFLTKIAIENRIPFDIIDDPFYSAENMRELKRRIASFNNGTSVLKEHDLIEID